MKPDAGTCSPEEPKPLRSFELQIWERAEHWYHYETVQALDEAHARALFKTMFGRGYRLDSVHALN